MARSKIIAHLVHTYSRIRQRFMKTYIANICKHSTKLEGDTSSFDKKYSMSMPLNENGHPDYCLTCIGEMAIRCAWCGESIVIGEPITLNIPVDSYIVPKYAVRYLDDPRYLVGCLRWECATSGIERAGFWIPPGIVNRVPTPLELLMGSATPQDKMVIVHDLGDQNNIGEVRTLK